MLVSRLIVNADDFGYNEMVNRAILSGFESSLLTSTSLMANMPGFDDAVDLIRKHSFLQQHVGLHLNLTEGYALSRSLRGCPAFCGADGQLVYDRERSLFRLSRKEGAAIYEELQTQLERVLAAGIRPVHLDSHHHTHTEWAIAPLVCRLARANGIRRIRLTRNMGMVPSRAKRWYKKIFNVWFLGGRSGFVENTDYFGDIQDMHFFIVGRAEVGRAPKSEGRGRSDGEGGGRSDGVGAQDLSFEIMVHPLFDGEGRLVDMDGKDLRAELAGLRIVATDVDTY